MVSAIGFGRCLRLTESSSALWGGFAVYDRDALVRLIREKALKFGDFTLTSGKKSSYYLDAKQVTLHPEGARLVGEGILELMEQIGRPDAVGGMSVGADPITAAVVTISAIKGKPVLGFMVRKEAKGHGTKRFIEGPVEPEQTAIIVEDVITTGGSSLQAAERAAEFGLKVVGIIGIIDRLEGGAEAFAARGIPYRSLLTIRDLGIPMPSPEASQIS